MSETKQTPSAYAVNYTISFGADILPEDIQKKREWLNAGGEDSLWDMSIDKDSSDEEIAKFIGVENYADFIQTEKVDMEMEETYQYSQKDTERITTEYHERIKEFKRMNNIK